MHGRGGVNAHGFDRMVRGIGAKLSRRGVLRGFGAGVFAAGNSRAFSKGAGAQSDSAPAVCGQDADCFDADLDPCTGSACIDGLCTYFIVDCIPGHVCCGNGTCCPSGEAGACLADADCAQDSGDPCQGFRCEGGTCAPFLVSCAPGFACCGNGVCCPVAGGCAGDTDCTAVSGSAFGSMRCVSGVCVPTSTVM